jgi:putative pyruvate formate lyase activating enzyme
MDYIPNYLRNISSFENKINLLKKEEKECRMCGNFCKVNRDKELGLCRTSSDKVVVSESLIHVGEEYIISGYQGSGAIFFGNCNMRCVFCQNSNISQLGEVEYYNCYELAELMLRFQSKDCHNIELISPTHCVPTIVRALNIAANRGLKIPIIYNSGGFDSKYCLDIWSGLIDIYVPDIKWSNNTFGMKYSLVRNYSDINQKAIRKMYEQVGNLKLNDEGVAYNGLLIRHLVLPNNINNIKDIAAFIKKDISQDVFISLLKNYKPFYNAPYYIELKREVTEDEYAQVKKIFNTMGLKNIIEEG